MFPSTNVIISNSHAYKSQPVSDSSFPPCDCYIPSVLVFLCLLQTSCHSWYHSLHFTCWLFDHKIHHFDRAENASLSLPAKYKSHWLLHNTLTLCKGWTVVSCNAPFPCWREHPNPVLFLRRWHGEKTVFKIQVQSMYFYKIQNEHSNRFYPDHSMIISLQSVFSSLRHYSVP